MRLVVVCGMPSEKGVLEQALPGVLVLSGADKDNLPALVPLDTTHIASAGLYGGLSPTLQIADVNIAGSLTDGAGNTWSPDAVWIQALLGTLQSSTPTWLASRAAVVSWYSSGAIDQADTAPQRAALLAQTGACAIDDESHSIAQFAASRSLKFAIMRACSDDASDTLPLAMRGQIMNADGSANIEYFLEQIASEPLGQTLDIPKIVAGYNSSLAALEAAAPCLLQSLL